MHDCAAGKSSPKGIETQREAGVGRSACCQLQCGPARPVPGCNLRRKALPSTETETPSKGVLGYEQGGTRSGRDARLARYQ